MLRDSGAGRRGKSRPERGVGRRKRLCSRNSPRTTTTRCNAAYNANTNTGLSKTPPAGWEEAAGSFTMPSGGSPWTN